VTVMLLDAMTMQT